jgi:Fe-S cluster assembly iron-binding protein IscA
MPLYPTREVSMLTVTPQASEVIRGILASDEVPDDAVVRISPEAEQGLAITLVESPEVDDQVIEAYGVEICVEQSAAEVLDDKQLDASRSGENVAFSISPKGSQDSKPEE